MPGTSFCPGNHKSDFSPWNPGELLPLSGPFWIASSLQNPREYPATGAAQQNSPLSPKPGSQMLPVLLAVTDGHHCHEAWLFHAFPLHSGAALAASLNLKGIQIYLEVGVLLRKEIKNSHRLKLSSMLIGLFRPRRMKFCCQSLEKLPKPHHRFIKQGARF